MIPRLALCLSLCWLPVLLVSCGSQEPLEVKQFTLRDVNKNSSSDLFIQGERRKRLYGAIEEKERENRKGQYYTARWLASPAGGPVTVSFEYQQAATGSVTRRLEHRRPAAREGVVEFSIAGESYRKGGRVLAWRMQLTQDGRLLGEQKSFLWE